MRIVITFTTRLISAPGWISSDRPYAHSFFLANQCVAAKTMIECFWAKSWKLVGKLASVENCFDSAIDGALGNYAGLSSSCKNSDDWYGGGVGDWWGWGGGEKEKGAVNSGQADCIVDVSSSTFMTFGSAILKISSAVAGQREEGSPLLCLLLFLLYCCCCCFVCCCCFCFGFLFFVFICFCCCCLCLFVCFVSVYRIFEY